MIDLYCERLAPGIWAEPLNAVSNLAFFIAGFALLRLYKKLEPKNIFGLALIVLLFAIALGSSLFHTLATPWALQADVIPILLFQLVLLAGYARSVVGLAWYWVITLLFGFLVFGAGIGVLGLPLNGSDGYLAPLIFLFGLGVYHLGHVKAEPALLIICALIFGVSLAFRTMDIAICHSFPLGTHFIWHMLNGIVLYLCGRAYFLGVSDREEASPQGQANEAVE